MQNLKMQSTTLSSVEADTILRGLLLPVRASLRTLAQTTSEQKNHGLACGASAVMDGMHKILETNEGDVALAHERGLVSSKIHRLTLNEKRVHDMVSAVHNVIKLPDPIGSVMADWSRPSGLDIKRVRVPLGLIGMIYEARPNVTLDALSLSLKSGNGVLLRPGSDCAATARLIFDLFCEGWHGAGLDRNVMAILRSQDRELVGAMFRAQGLIDVIVPRGGKDLVERVLHESKVPVFGHLSGLCHMYVDKDADLDMALKLIVNGKMRNTAICGATETVLIHESVAQSFIPKLYAALCKENCELRGCEKSKAIVPDLQNAEEQDWHTEYLEPILSCKVVSSLADAASHIDHYGSHHTDCIVTDNQESADAFMDMVDSAIVMHNVSTQFADGGEFGMGAEIGIATGRMHARGPVGLEQMTTMQYRVSGSGLCRD